MRKRNRKAETKDTIYEAMNTNHLTLALAFHKLIDRVKTQYISPEYLRTPTVETEYIHNLLNISPVQCMVLAAMLKDPSEEMNTSEIAQALDVSPVIVLDMQHEIDDLMSRGFIYCVKDALATQWQQTFVLAPNFIAAVRRDSTFETLSYNIASDVELLEKIDSIYDDIDYSRINMGVGHLQIMLLIEGTKHLTFSKNILALSLTREETLLLALLCNRLAIHHESSISSSLYTDMFTRAMKIKYRHTLKSGKSALVSDGLLNVEDGFDYDVAVTNKAKDLLLSDINDPEMITVEEKNKQSADAAAAADADDSNESDTNDEDDYSLPTPPENDDDDNDDDDDDKAQTTSEIDKPQIVEKPLFFNRTDGMQIKRLYDLLSVDNFTNVQARMREAGLRPGFTAIIHGTPGTGKTECIMQIARSTGREIILVNLSTLRDKWVGNSEKNVQAIFDDYNLKRKRSAITPILVFNEADGIFSKRLSSPTDSVDQMQNTMQNIILQNMETFEGILIATTNMTENFDKAFERRFLYKIELHRPDASVREKIWMSHMPSLTQQQAKELATRFELSGGQIENVARKHLIDYVLYGTTPDVAQLSGLCREELSLANTTRKRTA